MTEKVTLPLDDLVCDGCGQDIVRGEVYIETKFGDIYCDEDELLEDLELQEYFTWKQKD